MSEIRGGMSDASTVSESDVMASSRETSVWWRRVCGVDESQRVEDLLFACAFYTENGLSNESEKILSEIEESMEYPLSTEVAIWNEVVYGVVA